MFEECEYDNIPYEVVESKEHCALAREAAARNSAGCHLFRKTLEEGAHYNDRVSEALTVAEESDVVILCLGLDATIEGEEGGSAVSLWLWTDLWRYLL